MKKIYLIFISLAFLLNSSCDDYLDIVPDNVTTLDHAFSDKVSAERFLATIYSYMPKIGDCSYDPAIQSSDEFVICESTWDASGFANYPGNRIKSGLQNTNSPYYNFWEGINGGRGLFIALRDCNIFLENIDKVGADLYEDEREQWIAEVKFFKAFYHFYLLRMYGPIPLIKENFPISSGTSEIRMYRDTFDDCVDYIVQLLDEALEVLPLTVNNAATEYGRIVKPIAATLKADVLITAASPLFNGNTDFAKLVDNRGIKLFNETYDESKWQKAAKACKEAIDICNDANISLYTFNDNRYSLSDQTKQLLTIRNIMTKWNQEMIWANPQATTNGYQTSTLPFLTQAHISAAATNPAYGASLNMAELFYSKNGVPIEEDI
ncbi:MAG: RagB/SusD family nutrient uptake outer membrane protein [Bacteroidales bacterium]|nr:RagB/SusD family nutrient uptake outer membrane protein [Bacteroidales bacterium]